MTTFRFSGNVCNVFMTSYALDTCCRSTLPWWLQMSVVPTGNQAISNHRADADYNAPSTLIIHITQHVYRATASEQTIFKGAWESVGLS